VKENWERQVYQRGVSALLGVQAAAAGAGNNSLPDDKAKGGGLRDFLECDQPRIAGIGTGASARKQITY